MEKPFLLNLNNTQEDLRPNLKDIDYRNHLVDILGLDALKKYNLSKKILIFTIIDDPEIDFLGPLLLSAGIDYMRINIEQLLEYGFSMNITDPITGIIRRKKKTGTLPIVYILTSILVYLFQES